MSHQYQSVYARQAADVSPPWKVAAAFFAALQLMGYMILAIVIGDPSGLQLNVTASTICAFFFIGTSCSGLFWIAISKWQQRHFIIYSLFLPFSVLNVFALINILLHMPGHYLAFTTLRIVGISLPAVSSVVCTLTAGLLYRECREKSTSPAPLLNPNEQELQRRQLLRLLEEQSSSAPSPELVRNTYRFDLPDDAQDTWKPIAHEWRRSSAGEAQD